MSSSEKKLLIFFAIGGFIFVNIFALNSFIAYQNSVKIDRQAAKRDLDKAELFLANKDQVIDEMNWLTEHEPEPAEEQVVQTNLRQFAATEAENGGLTMKTAGGQKDLGIDKSGLRYHRAKIEFTVTGTEQAFYAWVAKLQIPTEFRAVTYMNVHPSNESETKIEATLIIEQWFIPATT
jgi:hypothetical protein